MMPPGEAVTMVTDYLLALVGFLCAGWLWTRARGGPGRWWAAALAATAVAAVLGGTSHGYAPVLTPETYGRIWRLTYVTAGLGSFCILYGAAQAALPRRWWRAAAALLGLRLVAVSAALIVLSQFRFVLYDYAITLLGLLGLAAVLGARRAPEAGWVRAGVAASAIGAVVQLTHLGAGLAFNHNDLFHVIQAIGLVCYARGGRCLSAAP
jgi:hypothetical protein